MGEVYDSDCNAWKSAEAYEKAFEIASKVEPHDNDFLTLFQENAEVARQNVIKLESKIDDQERTTEEEHD
jgi:hypothetical protein